jgi:hypothetical protein
LRKKTCFRYRKHILCLFARTHDSFAAFFPFSTGTPRIRRFMGNGNCSCSFSIPGKNIMGVVLPYIVAAALFHALYDFVLFVSLPMKTMHVASIVILLWMYASRKIKYLVAHSPFLRNGECPECGAAMYSDKQI